MIPLMEMLMQGGNGAAMTQIAKQFGLNQAQAEKAVEALMPAFSQGLKRTVSDPAGLAKFMAAMAGGAQGSYFDNPQAAASQEGRGMGDAILGQLFGSKDVSRAVAAQAAQATGLSQSILKQMLPMLAPILLGGLFKQMTGGGSGGSNPLGRIFEEMMKGGGNTPQQRAPQADAGNPWGQILEEMMGGAGQQRNPAPRGGQPGSSDENPLGRIIEEMMRGGQSRHTPQGREQNEMPQAENPLGRILEEMLGGGRAGGKTKDSSGRQTPQADNPLGEIFNDMLRGGKAAQPEPEPERNQWREPSQADQRAREPRYQPNDRDEPAPQTKGGLEDLFGKMFDTGRETQYDYQRGVEQIFDQFMGGTRKR